MSKPLSTALKSRAAKSPSFNKFCTSFGQISHKFVSSVNIIASGYKVVKIKPLEPEEASSAGISMMSDLLIMGGLAGIMIYEYQRSEEKNAAKAKAAVEKEAAFQQYLKDSFSSIETKFEDLDKRLKDIESRMPPSPASNTKQQTSSSTSSTMENVVGGGGGGGDSGGGGNGSSTGVIAKSRWWGRWWGASPADV